MRKKRGRIFQNDKCGYRWACWIDITEKAWFFERLLRWGSTITNAGDVREVSFSGSKTWMPSFFDALISLSSELIKVTEWLIDAKVSFNSRAALR